MHLTLKDFEYLAGGGADELLRADLPNDPLALQTALRKHVGPDEALAIDQLRRVRKKALAKMSSQQAAEIIADDIMIQQASSLTLAAYKGAKILQRWPDARKVLDLCSGCGIDAAGFSMAGLTVEGCDNSQTAVFCASHNAAIFGCRNSCSFQLADVTAMDIPSGSVVHLDPDRRATGRRSASMADYAPGPEFIAKLLARRDLRGAIKLSPALPKDELAALGVPVDVEYISTHHTCRQMLAWFPAVDGGSMTATVIRGEYPDHSAESITATGLPAEYRADAGRYLIEPDPAVLAAGAENALAKKLSAWKLAPGLVWLFADETPPASAAGQVFEIVQTVPGRLGDIKKALKNLDAGMVELKTRGVEMDVDKTQKQLRGKGNTPFTILWGRAGLNQVAFIAKR